VPEEKRSAKCPEAWIRYRNFVKDEVKRVALHQSRAFLGLRIPGATSSAAVIPDAYGLQAGNTDDTTSFDNYPTFHEASLERPSRCGNALFG